MLSKRLLVTESCLNNLKKFYTIIVERHERVPNLPKNEDQRKYNLKSRHFHYKLVDCLHIRKWGNIDLILTEYVEGVGHKGEIVNVPRHLAYYELLPARLAVYPTEEYMEIFKKERESLSTKAKVSPYAMKTKEELSKLILDIPMNMDTDWSLAKDNIRIALRYNKIMCSNDSIIMPEALQVNRKNYKNFQEPFLVKIKVNDYVECDLKCRITSVDHVKLWEEFTIFNKKV